MAVLGLDWKGFVVALALGVGVYVYGGLGELLTLISFLFVSLYITSLGYVYKARIGTYDYERGWKNVVSNGLFPLVFSVMGMKLAFLGSVAAITADKFASELGILGEKPIEVFTWKRVKRGKSGAFSTFGTLASLIGSTTIAFLGIHFLGINAITATYIALAGFLGSAADTIVGFLEERGIGTKETSNMICSLVGGLLTLLI